MGSTADATKDGYSTGLMLARQGNDVRNVIRRHTAEPKHGQFGCRSPPAREFDPERRHAWLARRREHRRQHGEISTRSRRLCQLHLVVHRTTKQAAFAKHASSVARR
jgi:hypothetical protein